jgi:hypothetical protein
MINNSGDFQEERFSSESDLPTDKEKNGQSTTDKLKDYGKESLSPFLTLLHKYQGQLNPYMKSLVIALKGGAEALQGDAPNEADKFLCQWFSDAANWVGQAEEKLKSGNTEEFVHFIEEQGRKHSGLMFSASYLTGIFLGRIGRHVSKKHVDKNPNYQSSSTIQ